MDVRALAGAPGARQATGADIMRDRDLKINTRRDTFEGRAGPKPGAAAGLQIASHDSRVQQNTQNKTTILHSIKKWLKDKKQKKIEAAKAAAENAAFREELGRKIKAQEREDNDKKIRETIARYKANMGQPQPQPQKAPQKAPMTAPLRNQAAADGAKIAQQTRPAPSAPPKPGQLPQARPAQPQQQPQKPPKEGMQRQQPKPQPQPTQGPAKPPKDKQGPPKPQAKAPPKPSTPQKPPAPKGKQMMAPPKPSLRAPAPLPAKKAAPPTLLRGKKGGKYYLSKGKKKVYVGKK